MPTPSLPRMPYPAIRLSANAARVAGRALATRTAARDALRRPAIAAGSLAVVAGATAAAPMIGLDQQAMASILLCGAAALLPHVFGSAGAGLHHPVELPLPPPSPDAESLQASRAGADSRSCRLPSCPPAPAQPQHLIFDEHGEAVPVDQLGEHYGYPAPDFDLAGYVVRNAGAVQVEGRCIRLSPQRVTPRALSALLQHLTALGPEAAPVDLRLFDGGWIDVPCRNPAAARTAVLSTMTHGIEPYQGFNCTDLPASSATTKLRDDLLEWRAGSRVLTEEALRALRRRGLLDRTVILSDEGSDLHFRFIGNEVISRFGREWAETVIDGPDNGMPDPDFAIQINRGYHEALAVDDVKLARIDAVIRPQGAEPVRVRYERLVVPCRALSGRRALLVSSQRVKWGWATGAPA